GKKSVAMDLKNPLAVDAFKKLAEKCDVLIDPFRPGVLEKNGLGMSGRITPKQHTSR
ncbi:hypothetical protein SARC_16517, partial [Sphaeroforma arctica JP610]